MIPEDVVAQVCHEANRVIQMYQADPAIPVSQGWYDLDQQSRESLIDGIRLVRRGATQEESHTNWVKFKLDRGWKYGPVKDEAKLEHPLLVPYEQLPESQKLKDELFVGIVRALS